MAVKASRQKMILTCEDDPRIGAFMKRWPVVQIGDLASSYGMAKTLSTISEFSCPLNAEIENFLKDDAIDFTARKSMKRLILLAYFALK